MALDLFLKGSNRPVIRGTLKDISDALWEVQESINAGSFGIDAASVTFDPTSTDMSATDVDAAIKANWTDIRNIDIDGNTRTILIRADTAANLASADAVLAEFELVYESDTGLSKLGDGATAYTLLPYTDTGSFQLFPELGFVESDGSGNWALSWNDDIRDKGKIILSRAEGDVAALVAILPADLPIGPEVVLLVPEAATIRAQDRTFSVAASWVDDAGQGLVTLDDTDDNGDPVTTATLGLTAGDAVTHSAVTTISEIVSASQFKTVAASGTGSGEVSIVAPADTIDEARTLAIGSNSIAGGGTNMVFYRVTESTPTARGKIKSGERPLYANGVIADNSTSALAGETVQAQLDELAGLIDTASGLSAITPQISAPNSTSGAYTLTDGDAVLTLDEGDLVFNAGVVAENTDNPATALTQLLPTAALAGVSFNIIREKGQTGEVKVRGADYNLVLTATATSGSPTLTGLTEAQTAWIAAGDAVSGTHVAGGATILSKTTTTLTMSVNATGSGSTSITVVVREAVFGRASDAPRDLTLPAPGPNSEAIITSLVCLRQTTTGPFVPACWLTSERENGGSLTIPVELGTSVSSPSISFSGTLDAELHNGRQINATNDITIPVADGLKVLIYATTSLDVNAGGAAVAMVEGDMIYVFVVGSEVRYTPVLATSEMATS